LVYTGSHTNAVVALSQGTVDVAANAWYADNDTELTRARPTRAWSRRKISACFSNQTKSS
jgi:ABC-type phosphate/phosphonate transport system substrate-binding protein